MCASYYWSGAHGLADRPDQIIIANESGELANPGVGMSGQGAVFKRGVYSGGSAQFIVKPKYWFGLFNDVVRGEVISSNVIVGPHELKFEGGQNLATVEAKAEGGTLKLAITYGRLDTFSLSAIDEHLRQGALSQIRIEGDRSTTGTLKPGAKHPWEKNDYSLLSFDWADPKHPGEGTCSVKIGEEPARSLTPPQHDLQVNKRAGSLTNNTTKTITYTLK
jgi:hypothetical protein